MEERIGIVIHSPTVSMGATYLRDISRRRRTRGEDPLWRQGWGERLTKTKTERERVLRLSRKGGY